MAKSIKKSSQKKSQYIKIKQFISRNKRESIISLLFALTLIAILGIGIYTQRIARTDKNNVDKMRNSLQGIATKLDNANKQQKWNDTSYCAVYKPRLFGDETRYACDASYEVSYVVESKKSIDEAVSRYNPILQRSENVILLTTTNPIYINELNSDGQYEQIRSYNFEITGIDNDKCSIDYNLTSLKVGYDLNISIKCHQSTKKAYFEPIEYK